MEIKNESSSSVPKRISVIMKNDISQLEINSVVDDTEIISMINRWGSDKDFTTTNIIALAMMVVENHSKIYELNLAGDKKLELLKIIIPRVSELFGAYKNVDKNTIAGMIRHINSYENQTNNIIQTLALVTKVPELINNVKKVKKLCGVAYKSCIKK